MSKKSEQGYSVDCYSFEPTYKELKLPLETEGYFIVSLF